MNTRRNDPQWLLIAQKQDIEARALRDVAKWFVIGVFAVLIGCAFTSLILPTETRQHVFQFIDGQ